MILEKNNNRENREITYMLKLKATVVMSVKD